MPPMRKSLNGGILWLMGVPAALMLFTIIVGML
jgi:hypothetical protein